jgi:hypothetical protein
MGPYEGVHRFLRRYLNFHDNPLACAAYSLSGDPVFLEQMRVCGANLEKGDLDVPLHVLVYPTAGVAGALRMIFPALLLPPDEARVHDNVIVPKWTYLSHSAEAALALGEVRNCNLKNDGQVDLDHLVGLIDDNTRIIMLATVGNPLGTAMLPVLFDEMLYRVHEKMNALGHPIVVVADTIYEPFRRRREDRIDPIQRVLKSGLEVPVIDTYSFSKIFAIAGYRLGCYRALWPEGGRFRDERVDFFTALDTTYGTTLCTVPSIVQKSVGGLLFSVTNKLPVEEELAPVATVIVSLKDLHDNRGGGDSNTLLPEDVVEDVIRRIGVDPTVWFTTSAIAKRARKLANPELGKYNVDAFTSKVEEIGEMLIRAGYIEKKEISISRARMVDLLTASVAQHGQVMHCLSLAIDAEKAMDPTLIISADQEASIGQRFMSLLTDASLRNLDVARGEVSAMQLSLGLAEPARGNRDEVKLTFYRLADGANVPALPRTPDGKIILEGVSRNCEWEEFVGKCGIHTEDQLLRVEMQSKLTHSEQRTDYFMHGLEQLAREGLGIYMHPSYYDEHGDLDTARVNSFYVLFGFTKLRGSTCQAAELVSLCHEVAREQERDKPILKFTPGEVFLPPDDRNPDDSFIRAVTLDRKENMDEVLGVIRDVATYLAKKKVPP